MTIKADAIKISGKLSFPHLLKTDDFGGKAAPKYSFSLTNLSERAEEALVERFGESAGMGTKRVRFNENRPEDGKFTKFSSKFPIKVKLDGRDILVGGRDSNGDDVVKILDPIAEKIGYGSTCVVKVFADGMGNPRVAYLDIVDLVTFESDEAEDDDDDIEVL